MQHADDPKGMPSGESPARREPPRGRVLSVRGSQAKVEFPAVTAYDLEEARVTVGKSSASAPASRFCSAW